MTNVNANNINFSIIGTAVGLAFVLIILDGFLIISFSLSDMGIVLQIFGFVGLLVNNYPYYKKLKAKSTDANVTFELPIYSIFFVIGGLIFQLSHFNP